MSAVSRRIVLASGNAGKVREIGALLAAGGMEIVAQVEFGLESADETGATFVENALLKARHAAAGSGLAARIAGHQLVEVAKFACAHGAQTDIHRAGIGNRSHRIVRTFAGDHRLPDVLHVAPVEFGDVCASGLFPGSVSSRRLVAADHPLQSFEFTPIHLTHSNIY